jgi:predicted nucleic acid-binding protein
MLQPYLIDSSVYISALQDNDPFHDRSQAFLENMAHAHTEVIVPAIVLTEVLSVIRKHKNSTPTELLDLKHNLLAPERFYLLPLDEALIEQILLFPGRSTLKTNDFLIVATAWATRSLLITWDKQMLKQALPVTAAKFPEN